MEPQMNLHDLVTRLIKTANRRMTLFEIDDLAPLSQFLTDTQEFTDKFMDDDRLCLILHSIWLKQRIYKDKSLWTLKIVLPEGENLVYAELQGEEKILKFLQIALPHQNVQSLSEFNNCYASIHIKRNYYNYISQFHVDEIYIDDQKFLKGVLETDSTEDVSHIVKAISALTKSYRPNVKSKILEYLFHKRRDIYDEIPSTKCKELTNTEKKHLVDEYLTENSHRYKTEEQKKQFRDAIYKAKVYPALINYEDYF